MEALKLKQRYFTVIYDAEHCQFATSIAFWQETKADYARLKKKWVLFSRVECAELCFELNKSLRIATRIYHKQNNSDEDKQADNGNN